MENNEIKFAKILEDIKYDARSQGGFVEEKMVYEAFEEMDLSKEQFELVFQYLKDNKIGINEALGDEAILNSEDRDVLSEYKDELSMVDSISDGEKQALIMAAMNNETESYEKIITSYLPKVMEIAKLYSDQGVALEDLIGEGNLAVAEGVTMLGALEHPSEADGMMIKLIMDAMEEVVSENFDESSKEMKIADKVNKVAEAAAKAREELGRKVSVEELVSICGLSKKSVIEAVKLSGNKIEDIETKDV